MTIWSSLSISASSRGYLTTGSPGQDSRSLRPGTRRGTGRRKTVQPEKREPSVKIDARVLAKLRQNMGNIDPVIRVFIDSLPQRLHQLEEAAGRVDFELVRRLAHTLKGSSSQFGAVCLAGLCQRVENMAKNNKLEEVGPLLAEIRKEAGVMRDFLAEELDKK